MRKITDEAAYAFIANIPFSSSNTKVTVSPDETRLLLHGNCIAINAGGVLSVTTAGWPSNATKERLNGLPGVRVNRKKGDLYLNGVLWDGKWTVVK